MPSSYTRLYTHIIFSTKLRAPLIGQDLRRPLESFISGIASNLSAEILAIGGVEDHMHLLVQSHPTVAMADLVRGIKANSSRWINESRPDCRGFAWQSGYAAFSVSQSAVAEVAAYIGRQEEHHRVTTFREEVEMFFRKHGVDVDPRWFDEE